MAFLDAQGTTFEYSTDSGSTYTAVPQVMSIDPISASRSEKDRTTLDDATHRVKAVGLIDQGSFSLTVKYDQDNAAQAGLETLFTNGNEAQFRLTSTDGTPTTYTFDGFVSGIETMPGAEVDGDVELTATILVNGAVTKA